MARPSKHDGVVYKRNDGRILWMSYRDRSGKRIRESTFTENWDEAQRKLRERLQARDDRILDIVLRKGEHFRFADWAEFFSPSRENYSQPPIRAHRTHEANLLRCSAHLKKAFEDRNLGDLTADDVELYLRRRLQDLECQSELPQVSFSAGGSSPQRCIRNCGYFAEC